MSFLLDTNVCSGHIKDGRKLFPRFVQYSGRLYVSRIVLAELYTWAYGKADSRKHMKLIERLLIDVQVLEFDDASAQSFGLLRAQMRPLGIVVGAMDLLIASTAIANGFSVVTHNVKDFSRIPGLAVVDWLSP